ncbi:hypothetical protein PbJCM13498_18500 [Prolixibacter bellariivorans]|uniref:ABC transporter permease n=1 Tax=Prolixibacter bellariivorans TaxID=314319 RepID=A0A5M4B001_9BACT|nr:hypothetical protein [Prolixibacter bellariivorans]GET32987.1 hypothetical protein PbJCM13498_18500 [Prolixibacter bellariivorans]
MLKALFIKEWTKIRWILIGFFAVALFSGAKLLLDIHHQIELMGAGNLWDILLFNNFNPYRWMEYVPLLTGIAVALAQFIPEVQQKRIKLMFHLPVNENQMLMQLTLMGNLFLLTIFLSELVIALVGITFVLPKKLILDAFITVAPWFLGGITAYHLTTMIVFESMPVRRLSLILVASAFISLFYQTATTGAYRPALPLLAIITILTFFTHLYTAYRFRKGIHQ